MTALIQIFQTLEASSDPLIVADSDSRITWSNEIARQQFFADKNVVELGDIFEGDIVQQILQCEHFACVPILKKNDKVPQSTAIVICLGTGDPDDETFLIFVKSSSVVSASSTDKDDSSAALAHDLKNPLGAIFGYADAILDTPVGSGMSDKQRDILVRIRSTAARSIELVRNLQHLSQLKSNSNIKPATPCDLNQVVESVIHHTWREDPTHPEVKQSLENTQMFVTIDRVQLDRILTNLYTNALKFTPLDGKITIKSWKESKLACLAITNSAPLLPPEELGTIFEKHVRGSTSKGVAGSGLGLYIVKQLVERAGGTISASSAPGVGTTFTLRLPVI